MIISWQLLKQFIDLPVSPEEAAARLTMTGAEVEYIEKKGESLSGISVAQVEELMQHPTKENLLVAHLKAGKGQVTCVTAATNLKAGDNVFYGAPGAVLHDGTRLSVRDFDGVQSAGMMLSGAELGLPEVDTVHGILVLPSDAPVGADAKTLYGLNDTLLDVSVTPNRGDLLSVLGVARELKGLYPESTLKPLPWQTLEQVEEWPVDFQTISLPDSGCLCYRLGLATGVSIGPSPLEVRVALAHMGMRPLSNVVDATNYTMLLLGQPMHAFDLNTLPAMEITVRAASDGETIVTLDGKERVLTAKDMLITSGGKPIALAGVMGGDTTGINADTHTVVLESAAFSPLRVGHTSRRLGLLSEAAGRYARGVDPVLSSWGIDCALSLMAKWSGAKVGYKTLSAQNTLPETKSVVLTRKKLSTYLLWDNFEQSQDILEGFGVQLVQKNTDTMSFMPPSWRPDITIEEDLIEEIGRFRGYDEAPVLLPDRQPCRGDIGAPTALAAALRTRAVGRGYVEAVTYSFLPESFVSLLRLPQEDLRAHPLTLANPISQEQVAMRTTLIPGLLNGLKESIASGWRGPIRLFEQGRTFLRTDIDKTEHVERDVLAGLVFNGTDPRTPWKDALDDFLSVKADVEALLLTQGYSALFESALEPFGHKGQTAHIHLKGHIGHKGHIGYLARLKPAIARELGISEAVYIFELDLLLLEKNEKASYRPSSPFPASFRDISLLVPNDKTHDEVLAEIRNAAAASDTDLLKEVALFDLYRGKGIPEGFRSMAFSLCYRAFDRTLNDDEVDKIHNAVRDTLVKTGYNIR